MTVGIMISNGIGHGTAPLQTLSGVGVMVAIVLFGLVLKRLVPKLPLMLFLAALSTVVTIPSACPLADPTTAVVKQIAFISLTPTDLAQASFSIGCTLQMFSRKGWR